MRTSPGESNGWFDVTLDFINPLGPIIELLRNAFCLN